MLPGGDTQLRRGAERILPQRVRAGLGVQLLQGLYGGGRNVPGRRNPGNVPNQSAETAADAQLARVGWADPTQTKKKTYRDYHFVLFVRKQSLVL